LKLNALELTIENFNETIEKWREQMVMTFEALILKDISIMKK
jgi:hypothetical protein